VDQSLRDGSERRDRTLRNSPSIDTGSRHLFVAEPQGRWQGHLEKLVDTIQAAGFSVMGEVEQRYDFLYLTAAKV
jgi:hypothetical protein